MGYYQGDPGFFSFLGGLAKTVGGFIPGVGPLVSAAGGAIEKIGARSTPALAASAGGLVPKIKGIVKAGGTQIIKHPVLSAAGAAGAVGTAAAVAHVIRSKGGASAVGMGRRHRRMNVCNPRALRRAIRRTQGFAHLAMKTIHIIHPKKKGRFGGFRKRKRK